MPHVVYVIPGIVCPWAGCGFQIELVDFQLEKRGDQALYARVMTAWGQPGFGVVGRCPGCGQYVLFGDAAKQAVADPSTTGLPVLPDDWHLHAYIA